MTIVKYTLDLNNPPEIATERLAAVNAIKPAPMLFYSRR
jgi:hypothetical protein